MLPFASAVLTARRVATRMGALATFGKVRVDPNATNAIPSRIDAWLDGRAPDSATVDDRTGVSHSPAEHAESVDCAEGVLALAAVVEDLACR
jgi:N-carbamoyl-L-amino-acid hydrolase